MSNLLTSLTDEIRDELMKELKNSVDIDNIVSDKDLFYKYVSLMQTKIHSKIKTVDKDLLQKQAAEFLEKNKDNPIIQDMHMQYVENKSPIKSPLSLLNINLNEENISDTYKILMKDIQKESIDELSKIEKLEDIENLFNDKETLTKHITTLIKKINQKIVENNLDIETLQKDYKNMINNNLEHPILGDFYKKINIEVKKQQQAENAKSEDAKLNTS